MSEDIYIAEARRRLAGAASARGFNGDAAVFLQGNSRAGEDVVLADALRELNWKPPVDPDEAAVAAVLIVYGKEAGWGETCLNRYASGALRDGDWKLALAAYRAGKAAGGAT